MIAVKMLPVALLCGCAASLSQAAVLPTGLEAKVGANYEPADAEERAIWQSLARLEQGIRTSPQRLIAPELDAYIRSVFERLIDRRSIATPNRSTRRCDRRCRRRPRDRSRRRRMLRPIRTNAR